MRFLKGAHSGSPADASAAARLNSVASRSKLEVSKHLGVKAPPASHTIQQRFWRPDELVAQGDHE